MTQNSLPPSDVSRPGRRVLVAVVTGEVGDRVQAWRLEHDNEQAHRLPPHTTLCYWAPELSLELDQQIRHAFSRPVTVTLGQVHELDNVDRTFYLNLDNTAELNAARRRLYDGTYLKLNGREDWTWHVTCVRYGVRHDLHELRQLTASFTIDAPWTIKLISLLELRGDRYEELKAWCLTVS